MSSPTPTKDGLWSSPNLYARPQRLTIHGGQASFDGYQQFLLNADPLFVSPRDELLVRKDRLLEPLFTPRFLFRRRVLDLGANGGFFSFRALQAGASEAVAVDLDESYVRMLQDVKDAFQIDRLRPAQGNVADWTEPADVVVALALIHWIYSCTTVLGSVSDAVARLASLTNDLLIIEWVEPDDPAIQEFRHLDWNTTTAREPYSFHAFETALGRHSRRWEHLGDLTPTRKLYAAFMKDQEIDLSTPLPALFPEETSLASRRIATRGGVDYWSRVYVVGDRVHKQASFDLAEREALILSTLTGPWFPRVLSHRQEEGYSVLEMEKIEGVSLEDARGELGADPGKLARFLSVALDMLGELRAKRLQHRDIRPGNVLVRDGTPVLIDFGWAASEAHPAVTPPGLGENPRLAGPAREYDGRPPDGSFCDVYSMGRLVDWILDGRESPLRDIMRLMAEPDPSLRLTDLEVLKALVSAIMNGMTVRPPDEQTLAALLDLLARRDQKLTWLESTLATLGERRDQLEARNRELEAFQGRSFELAMLRENACQLAECAAAMRESRVMRLAQRVKGEPDLWETLPDAFQALKSDAIRNGPRKRGSRLAESPSIRTSRTYPLSSRIDGLRAVLISVIVDVAGCGGLLALEVVSPSGEVVARGELGLDAVRRDVPTRIELGSAVDVGGPGWQLTVSVRGSRSPVRIHELRTGGRLSLEKAPPQPFFAAVR